MKKPLLESMSLFALLAVLAWGVAPAQATIVFGQIDDFEDATTQSWSGGAGPANIPTGGPAGVGDHFLQMIATGGSGPGSRLGSYNDNQWTGDYLAAGVTSIEADLRNFGSTGDLSIRLLFFGTGGNFTSTIPLIIPNDGDWHHVIFGITPADLTAVDGGFDVNATLSGTNRLLIRHQVGPPGGQFAGTSIDGEMGMDNITALPEPGTLSLLVFGMAALLRRRR
ncbi:MAG TPA: PEP-CTERM sorting domain-containing protein [Phycisphaerae bacterium]|nr:PEP-CTERM sorting domain-containing protein [Phycisphaerae bacterium]